MTEQDTQMLAERLDRLESREAIREVLYDYTRANDRKDPVLLEACFWPDATIRHGRFDGSPETYLEFVAGIHAKLRYAFHQITNIAIELDGDAALVESYYTARHRIADDRGGETDAFYEGRYIDLFARRGGEWKIAERRGLADLAHTRPAQVPTQEWDPGISSGLFPEDPYYAMRESFLAGR